jgi:hypothetical protein
MCIQSLNQQNFMQTKALSFFNMVKEALKILQVFYVQMCCEIAGFYLNHWPINKCQPFFPDKTIPMAVSIHAFSTLISLLQVFHHIKRCLYFILNFQNWRRKKKTAHTHTHQETSPNCFKLINFIFQIVPCLVSDLTMFRLSPAICPVFWSHCNLACFMWSNNFGNSLSNHGLCCFNS